MSNFIIFFPRQIDFWKEEKIEAGLSSLTQLQAIHEQIQQLKAEMERIFSPQFFGLKLRFHFSSQPTSAYLRGAQAIQVIKGVIRNCKEIQEKGLEILKINSFIQKEDEKLIDGAKKIEGDCKKLEQRVSKAMSRELALVKGSKAIVLSLFFGTIGLLCGRKKKKLDSRGFLAAILSLGNFAGKGIATAYAIYSFAFLAEGNRLVEE